MATPTTSAVDPEWQDLDTDEIASVASEDLYAHRPNRWTGAPSTWRELTEEERHTWRSMKQLENQDLAVHLYNAFALKRMGRNEATAQDLMVSLGNGEEAIWAPPKSWTAWPLKVDELPEQGFFKSHKDAYDVFTFRKDEHPMPSTELQEELSAHIIRLAKERFRKRRTMKRKRGGESVRQSIEQPAENIGSSSENGSSASGESVSDDVVSGLKAESGEEQQMDEIQTGSMAAVAGHRGRRNKRRSASPRETFEPVVSADDDASRKLLAPSVRHILSRLDTTLTILHNNRVVSLHNLSESSSSDDNASSDSDTSAAVTPRRRGRPRIFKPKAEQEEGSPTKRSKRGRPTKEPVPLEGETPEETQRRHARQSHRRMPWTDLERDAAFKEWAKEGERISRRESRLRSRQHEKRLEKAAASQDEAGEEREPGEKAARESIIERFGLRDWSDVLSAAALAGFSADVLARTARRCADLFGESMTMDRLEELPALRGDGLSRTTFRPERIHLSSSDDTGLDTDHSSTESEEEMKASLLQRRIASRQASLAASRSSNSSSSPALSRSRGRRTSSPSAHSRSRSHSRSSAGAAATVFCPDLMCERSSTGFNRRANLARHIARCHPGLPVPPRGTPSATAAAAAASPSTPGGGGTMSSDESSGDEVYGAVRRDGFLKEIVPMRGWRGEDWVERKRKSHYGDREIVERYVSTSVGTSAAEEDADAEDEDNDGDDDIEKEAGEQGASSEMENSERDAMDEDE